MFSHFFNLKIVLLAGKKTSTTNGGWQKNKHSAKPISTGHRRNNTRMRSEHGRYIAEKKGKIKGIFGSIYLRTSEPGFVGQPSFRLICGSSTPISGWKMRNVVEMGMGGNRYRLRRQRRNAYPNARLPWRFIYGNMCVNGCEMWHVCAAVEATRLNQPCLVNSRLCSILQLRMLFFSATSPMINQSIREPALFLAIPQTRESAGGQIVNSIPNISHCAKRITINKGEWVYCGRFRTSSIYSDRCIRL